MTTFSPCLPGSVLTRRSIGPAVHQHVDAAVLRQPPLGDVQAGHDLDAAETTAGLHLVRRAELLVQRGRRRGSGRAGAFSSGSMWMSLAPSWTALKMR